MLRCAWLTLTLQGSQQGQGSEPQPHRGRGAEVLLTLPQHTTLIGVGKVCVDGQRGRKPGQKNTSS